MGGPPMGRAPAQPGELVITELMIDPKTLSDAQGEWVELYNPNAYELTLHGCELDDGGKTPRPFAGAPRLAPHVYATVARTAEPGFTADAVVALSLTNTADVLVLRCGGHEIDRVTYDKAQGYPIESGASLALDPARIGAWDKDDPAAWCAGRDSYGPERGTPGRANPPCQLEDTDAGGLPDEPEPSETSP